MARFHHPHPKVRRRDLSPLIIQAIINGERFGSCPLCSGVLALDHRLVCGAKVQQLSDELARGHARACVNCRIIWLLEAGPTDQRWSGTDRQGEIAWGLCLKAFAICFCRRRLDGTNVGFILATFPGKPPKRLRLAVEYYRHHIL